MTYLERVNSPDDLKKLTISELKEYAKEVREYIVKVVENRGGHLASNLGVVELTIAMHYVFDCPRDKFIFDVGHQSYTHKIITGRRDAFARLRSDDGISGFENMSESEYDAFTTGHSSTSLSVGLGIARARDLSGDDYNVVSVIGDGAFMNTQLNEARFSENTVYLGFGAFEGAGLQKALFSGNAEFIAKTAFGNNARTVIYCGKGADAEKYAAGNGMECRYFGDLDSDGLFTAADLLLLKRILLNGEAVSDPTASDANADGSVNMLDLVRLKKLAAEI